MRIFLIVFFLNLCYFSITIAFTLKYSACYQELSSTKNESIACNGNGRCHIFFGCECFEGFAGNECENIVIKNGCDFNKCHSESQCINLSSTLYYCICPLNRYGQFCEFEDPCYGCDGKCLETDDNIFECEREEEEVKELNQTLNSTSIDDHLVMNLLMFNESLSINETIEYTEIENVNVEPIQFWDYLISSLIILFVFFVLLILCILIVKRWKKVSREIEAENAAARIMFQQKPSYIISL